MAHETLPNISGLTRHLTRRTQIIVVAVAALMVGIGLVAIPALVRHGEIASEQAGSTVAEKVPGTFRPTSAQWASLRIAPVATLTFRSEEVTDGKIAIDDDHTTPVFSPYSGRVSKLIAKLGDVVEKGAPLIAVEASEFVQGQNDLVTAVAALNKARSQLTLAQITEKRQHELYLADAGALKDWEQAKADLAAVQSDLRSAEIALAATRNRLRIYGKSDKEISALENAQKMDPVAYVTAPISGTVTQRQVGLGQYIQSGAANPVYSIGDLSVVWLIANVREIDAPLMRVGQPVEVRVLAYPGRVFKAKIAWVAPSVDPGTHRLPVRAEVENSDRALKPEMFASFSITTGDASPAPAVPQDAIVYEGDTARVWVAQEDGSIASRSIRPGRINDGMVEILSGLAPGEKIVTSGTLFIDRAAQSD